jgi:hypothetical protein
MRQKDFLGQCREGGTIGMYLYVLWDMFVCVICVTIILALS